MKKIAKLLCLILAFVFLFCGCNKTIKGTDGLIEKVREVISVSDADTVEITYAGQHTVGNSAIFWFISGNEYQAHTYIAMECEIVGENEYKFVKSYEPMDRGEDIAVLNWNGWYYFLINNTDCRIIRITDSSGTRDIEIPEDEYPYMFSNEIPEYYYFLDADGNEIM